jgi:LacI family repressor for deo operon, udp, cdd, tsx, nupC, and nupG
MPNTRTRKHRGEAAPKRSNIREVAAAARVSVATVSRTLQTPDIVAEDTRKRVLRTIERLGYTPNLQARILRTARTQLIVALVPDISNPFFAEVIRGIEKVAHEHRYAVLLCDTQYDPVRERTYADLLGTRQADGMITLLPHVPRVNLPAPLPIVNACEYVSDRSITSVYVDNVAAARAATGHLLDFGHRRIAFVTGPMQSPISIDRDRGYAEALKGAGIARDPKLTAGGDFSVEAGLRAYEVLVANARRFTAVFCSGPTARRRASAADRSGT